MAHCYCFFMFTALTSTGVQILVRVGRGILGTARSLHNVGKLIHQRFDNNNNPRKQLSWLLHHVWEGFLRYEVEVDVFRVPGP